MSISIRPLRGAFAGEVSGVDFAKPIDSTAVAAIRSPSRFVDLTPDEIAAFTPVRHPLVRRHPNTGRPSLFLSAHAGAIVGWTVPEGRMFLRDLTEHATQREFVYSHAWKPHDLVMWDNRATMHRARRFDRSEVRDVRRTTLAGEPPRPL